MSTINYDLSTIKAVIFDVDGVLSCCNIPTSDLGEPMRTVNIKDGYAIQLAMKKGLEVVILTGGRTEAVRLRYERLGLRYIYMAASMKKSYFEDFMEKSGLKASEIAYMGDDIPDYEVMRLVGFPCCPADAAAEIKAISKYISHVRGGEGCARDILEQILKVQGRWMTDAEAFGW